MGAFLGSRVISIVPSVVFMTTTGSAALAGWAQAQDETATVATTMRRKVNRFMLLILVRGWTKSRGKFLVERKSLRVVAKSNDKERNGNSVPFPRENTGHHDLQPQCPDWKRGDHQLSMISFNA
jgi:hypothetical protein